MLLETIKLGQILSKKEMREVKGGAQCACYTEYTCTSGPMAGYGGCFTENQTASSGSRLASAGCLGGGFTLSSKM